MSVLNSDSLFYLSFECKCIVTELLGPTFFLNLQQILTPFIVNPGYNLDLDSMGFQHLLTNIGIRDRAGIKLMN